MRCRHSNKGSTASYLQQFLAKAPEEMCNEVLSYLTEADYLKLRQSSRKFCGPIKSVICTHFEDSFRRAVAKYTFPDYHDQNPWLFDLVVGKRPQLLSVPAIVISMPLQLAAKIAGGLVDLAFFYKSKCRNYNAPPALLKEPDEMNYVFKKKS